MSITSSFCTVIRNHYNIRHQWQKIALGNDCACEILSLLMFQYDNPTANSLMNEFHQIAFKKKGGRQIDTEKWLPYSTKYLRQLLLLSHSPNSILKAIDVLKTKGWLSDEVPIEIPSYYSKNVSWYRLDADAINTWISANFPVIPIQTTKTEMVSKKVEIKPSNNNDDAKNLGLYFRALLSKSNAFQLDSKRLKLIKNTLEKNG